VSVIISSWTDPSSSSSPSSRHDRQLCHFTKSNSVTTTNNNNNNNNNRQPTFYLVEEIIHEIMIPKYIRKKLSSKEKKDQKELQQQEEERHYRTKKMKTPADTSEKSMLPQCFNHEKEQSVNDEVVVEAMILLMDKTIQRFELLRVESERLKYITANNISKYIHTRSTEPTIREQSYKGLLDEHGMFYHIDSTTAISGRCKMLLMAVPSNASCPEILRFGMNILFDKVVAQMLSQNGYDITGWKSTNAADPTAATETTPLLG
jgi:uncharacterized protein (UPF0147 family)